MLVCDMSALRLHEKKITMGVSKPKQFLTAFMFWLSNETIYYK